MIVLALDQSTTAIGWALGSPGSAPTCGTFAPPKSEDKDDYVPFLDATDNWLRGLILCESVTHLFFEQPLMPRAGVKWVRKGKKPIPVPYVETNIDTLRKLYSLAGVIELLAGRQGVDCRETNLARWRSWFLSGQPRPKGTKALKAAVIARCEEYGWAPQNDNEGDALGIWAHGCNSLTGYVPQRGPGELFAETVDAG